MTTFEVVKPAYPSRGTLEGSVRIVQIVADYAEVGVAGQLSLFSNSGILLASLAQGQWCAVTRV